MTAYSIFLAGIALALHRQDDLFRGSIEEWDDRLTNEWRHRAAVTIAIVLWLLTWLGGWWLGRALSSGSIILTMTGAFFGWLLGLGLATLILYMDERL
ncbi:hypothetical protein EKPJFOCH_3984 [Methylobacterium thuringiense]|uniref:DUF3325 domain-containing protein n=1 Tax=Methylobacterium thuringiense TaxID=1003091 RepID=A0ABQ4TS23_9HYPH|nr:hypothetical protein EKPJFOCH_3984 [Methylobacterium thuringiense]